VDGIYVHIRLIHIKKGDVCMNRKTLTVQEVAVYLGVHQDTIYTMVRQKQIPHFRVRRRILFNQLTIDAWIEKQETMIVQEAI
jgi:excisionase family DNA binding protein